jgi:hypothetical protein
MKEVFQFVYAVLYVLMKAIIYGAVITAMVIFPLPF